MTRNLVISKDAGWEVMTVRRGDPVDPAIGRVLLVTAWWLLREAARAAWLLLGFLVGNPIPAAALVLAVAAGTAAGEWWPSLAVLVVAGAALLVWFWLDAERVDRLVASPWRCWRRRVRYRSHWPDLMCACEATVTDHRRRMLAPRLTRVRSGRFADVVTVTLPDGITTEAFSEHIDAVAEAMRAREARVVAQPGRRWLPAWLIARLPAEFAPPAFRPSVVRLAFGDPLVHVVLAQPGVVGATVDLAAVPVGLRDDGRPWTVRLLGTHVLLLGATGSGKGSVLWSLLAGVGPAIREGLVRVIGIDPKGGMELGFGRELFHELHTIDGTTGDAAVVGVLEMLAAEADRRAGLLAGKVRTLVPSQAMPFLLIVVDELASLTAFITDSKLRNRADAALGRLLTKGRAPGMCVVGAVQDPRKDVIKYRDLFPTRVALRLVEAGQVDLALGDGARRRGARCHLIPETSPGVGYVIEDGAAAVTRVRAAYLTDDDVRRLADTFRPAPTLHPLPATTSEGRAA